MKKTILFFACLCAVYSVNASPFVSHVDFIKSKQDTTFRTDTVLHDEVGIFCTDLIYSGWKILSISKIDNDWSVINSMRIDGDKKCYLITNDNQSDIPRDGVYEHSFTRRDGTTAKSIMIIENGEVVSYTCDGKQIISCIGGK